MSQIKQRGPNAPTPPRTTFEAPNATAPIGSYRTQFWHNGQMTEWWFSDHLDAISAARWAFRCGAYAVSVWRKVFIDWRPEMSAVAWPVQASEVDRLHKTCATGEFRPAPYPRIPGIVDVLRKVALTAQSQGRK